MPRTIKERNVRKIRMSIRRTKSLLKNGKIKQLNEEIAKYTNCYAYSLGVMYRGEAGDFDIGFTNHILGDERQSQKEIIDEICNDLENLKFKFRVINLNDDIALKKNEYIIKAFYTEPKPNEYNSDWDFHFLRQDRRSGKWFHKMGRYTQPEFVEDNSYGEFCFNDDGEPISLLTPDYLYKPLTYFAITE